MDAYSRLRICLRKINHYFYASHQGNIRAIIDLQSISSRIDITLIISPVFVSFKVNSSPTSPGHARDLQSVEMIHRGEIKEKIHDRLQYDKGDY